MKSAEDYIYQIQEACAALGWVIAMNDENEHVQGLVIGTQEFVTELVENLNDSFEVWEKAEGSDEGLH